MCELFEMALGIVNCRVGSLEMNTLLKFRELPS